MSTADEKAQIELRLKKFIGTGQNEFPTREEIPKWIVDNITTQVRRKAREAQRAKMLKDRIAAFAIGGVALLIALALLFAARYQITAPSAGAFVYRLDRWTGTVSVCNVDGCRPLPETTEK